MRKLNYELKNLCYRNVDGSFSTRKTRLKILLLAANQLHELGYRHLGAKSLKLKHTRALFEHWYHEQLSAGTIKNRLAHLRWWSEKVGKPDAIYASNDEYYKSFRFEQPYELRQQDNKAIALDIEKFDQVVDMHARYSLLLQAHFGLRREEAIKFRPSYADQGDHLSLKGSWTKGGKARDIPITKPEQVQLLQAIRQFVGIGSLIPPHKSYFQQLRIYESQTQRAGLHRLHGLRYAYAQQRYLVLTGWLCPKACGPSRDELQGEEKLKDINARQIISHELGHERLQIVTVYIG